jgi:hypothetical protein
MERHNKGNKGMYGLNYARGEKNGMAKLTDQDVVLMLAYKDSCQNDLDKIEREIERLKEKRIQLKKQMTRRYIADMFDISTVHCERIIRGDCR